MEDTIRLGYACINLALSEKKMCVNNSCIAKTVEKQGKQILVEKARMNLESVINILEWNEKHNIRFYRMSSDMFPHITNKQFIQPNDKYTFPLEQFSEYFHRIGEYAYDHKHRLTFHPSHFNQVGTPNKEVFEKTKMDLEYHADILNMCKCDMNSVMVVHGGGTYKDKETTKKRWIKQFFDLPRTVQERIVIENCERQYSIDDAIELSKHVKRPVVFDVHHHVCYDKLIEPQKCAGKYMKQVLSTWGDIRPKFHISEQDLTKKTGAHSPFVYTIPDYFFEIEQPFDIMIEAKRKEQAVLFLMDKYKNKLTVKY
jgi:UV DNA damage endonuclease